MKTLRINADQFEAIATLSRMRDDSNAKKGAFEVLVNGSDVKSAADKLGIKYKDVYYGTRRAEKALELALVASDVPANQLQAAS